MLAALLVLAQNSQSAPDDGTSIGLVIGTIVVIVLIVAAIFFVFVRGSKKSHGGVQPPPASREQGEPPFESIERDKS